MCFCLAVFVWKKSQLDPGSDGAWVDLGNIR